MLHWWIYLGCRRSEGRVFVCKAQEHKFWESRHILTVNSYSQYDLFVQYLNLLRI